ncbi:type I 3-dehydroquinate dehydratase [Lactiplantibacillus plantarum]|uniref:type I 3-dehydroquinate dehydratase n=1 Tax=Lactiplantibacillus plantarum TaxID=1590 RepID=UPI0028933842|nr:type I 3-dehydroquinate dehydratase [Lactiplantibacillus plantarum]WNJ65240.1 type I 3-dehydroquinate dehydratase [Lactiplantibacillus plantarum]
MKMKAGMVLKEVTVGELTLATGMPKIGVVLAGATREDLLRKAGQILTSVAQIVVWRLDPYQELDNRAELVNTAAQLQQVLGTIPLIAMFGLANDPAEVTEYYQTYQTLVNNRSVAGVDIDLAMVNQPDFMTLTKQMRANEIRLIASQTVTTATTDDLLAAYHELAATGADVVRVTVAGHDAQTVLALMAATEQARQQLVVPIVATATGKFGRYNSVCSQLTGSAVAFGHVGRVGDQSQLAVSQVKQALQMLAPLEGA